MTDDARVGICCPGGGAAGAAQAGMLCAFRPLFETGRVHTVSGASVGSLNACMAVQGDFSELWQLWSGIRRQDVYSKWALMKAFSGGVYSTKPLQRLIDKYVDPERVEGARTRLYVQACDRDTGAPVVWHTGNGYGDLRTMLLASASIPVLFPQVEARGCWLVDGGVVDNSPMEWLIREQCNEIWVLHCHTDSRPKRKEGQRTRLSMLAHTVRLLYRANQKHDLRIIKMHNALLKTSIGKREITVREVFPTFDVGTLDFDARVATRALEDGYIAAVEALRGVEC